MKYEISESQLNNLLQFLDRVELKGIKENQAFFQILHVLDNPIKEDPPKEETIKEYQ